MIDSEYPLIGAFLIDNSFVEQLPCDPKDFSDEQLGSAYAAIRDIVAAGDVADVVTVADRLRYDDALAWLTNIVNNTPGTSNVIAYQKMLKKRSRVRRAREVAAELADCQTPEDIEEGLSALIALSSSEQSHEHTQSQSFVAAIEHLEQLRLGVEPGLPTGLSALDQKLGGLQPSDLILLAARSQHGKTALMMNIANAQTVPVGIISGEQPHMQLALRSIAMQGEVDLKDMRTGELNDEQWYRIDKARKKITAGSVSIYDKGSPTIAEIEAVARSWAYHRGIKVLFVDFLQLVSGGAGDQHRLQVGDVARRLKALAKQLNIPIVALAQISRAIDKKPQGESYLGRMPYTADIADSAQIEDACDQIIALYRPEVYWPAAERLKGLTYLNVCKNRHGPIGFVVCDWVGPYLQFKDREAA